MKEKILTVSIASYNIEKYLAQALDSFLVGDVMDDIEVIIVNDGSKDKTSEIAHQYQDEYPNTFVVVDKENGGYGSTINTSLKMASGKYYKLLDGDDWFDKKELIKLISYLKGSNYDLVLTNTIESVEETGEKITLECLPEMVAGEKFSYKDYPPQKSLAMHQVCFRTEAIKNKDIVIRENCFYTDTEYLLKCLSFCQTIVRLDLYLYYYRVGLNEQSMSLISMNKHYKDFVRYYKEVIRFRNEDNKNQDYEEYYLRNALSSLARYHLTTFLLLTPCRKKEYMEFDRYIHDNARDVYIDSNCKTLNLIRKTKGIFFRPVSVFSKRRYKQKQIINRV